MASAQEAIYAKFIKIMDKHEKGELAGQGSKATDAKGGLKRHESILLPAH